MNQIQLFLHQLARGPHGVGSRYVKRATPRLTLSVADVVCVLKDSFFVGCHRATEGWTSVSAQNDPSVFGRKLEVRTHSHLTSISVSSATPWMQMLQMSVPPPTPPHSLSLSFCRSDSPVYQSSEQTSWTRPRAPALPLNSLPITPICVNDTTKETKCSS